MCVKSIISHPVNRVGQIESMRCCIEIEDKIEGFMLTLSVCYHSMWAMLLIRGVVGGVMVYVLTVMHHCTVIDLRMLYRPYTSMSYPGELVHENERERKKYVEIMITRGSRGMD